MRYMRVFVINTEGPNYEWPEGIDDAKTVFGTNPVCWCLDEDGMQIVITDKPDEYPQGGDEDEGWPPILGNTWSQIANVDALEADLKNAGWLD